MRLKLFTILIFTLFCTQAISQPWEIEWEKQTGNQGPVIFADILEDTLGGYTVLGSVRKAGENGQDLWLISFSATGDTLWSKIYPNLGYDLPSRLVADPENGYLLAGVNGNIDKTLKAFVIQVKADGTENWRKTSEEMLASPDVDIAVSPDGNLWWAVTIQPENGVSQIKLLKTNMLGENIAAYNFSDKQPLRSHAIRLLPDGTVAIAGQLGQIGKEFSNMWITRIKPDGQVIWKTVLPATNKKVWPECLCCSPDNALVLIGWYGSCLNETAPEADRIWDYDLILNKIDANGKVVWSKNFDREGSEGGNSIAVRPDGSLLMAGVCQTSFTGTIGPWLVMADKSGKLIKEEVTKFRFTGDQATRIINSADGGFVMIGPGKTDSPRNHGWIKKYKMKSTQ